MGRQAFGTHMVYRETFTTTADLRSSFRQNLHASNVCLLEDKIQDRGMYLFTISYGSYAVGSKKWRWLIQWMNKNLRYL